MKNWTDRIVSFLTGRKARPVGVSKGRMRTVDTAIPFRMGAGFPGDVNRTHPCDIEPALMSSTNPVLLYGLACIATLDATNSVRSIAAGDSGISDIYGVIVRPYPVQPATSPGAFGGVGYDSVNQSAPSALFPCDVLKHGYIMTTLYGSTAALKGSPVWVYTAVTGATNHVQGGFEAATATNSVVVPRSYFNGPADPSGIVELALHVN